MSNAARSFAADSGAPTTFSRYILRGVQRKLEDAATVLRLAAREAGVPATLRFLDQDLTDATSYHLELRGGLTVEAPTDISLLSLVREVWFRDCYHLRSLSGVTTIIDVGANIGMFSLYAGTAFPGARLIALEPSLRAYAFLCRNVERNGRNVKTLNCAAGANSGEADLYWRGSEVLNTLFSRDPLGGEPVAYARTPVVSLDDLFRTENIETCDLLKLDCEGAEYDVVFHASSQTLARIRRVAMEYHIGFNEHSPQEMEAFLGAHAFEVKTLAARFDGTGYIYARNRASQGRQGS